ncbi:hypothetical protein DUNSADRAFT_4578 [Dunaliella salina]|uniref:Uncharacterized protein n=1 Tax=Dunaliella salina TaxID=3046 RepID=A0ABQ7FUQ3_DUNSA|nr:hypothetical protein DUNSADRAFT_4578 [Dunaliella salina]|eukprot:KAF5826142.1 hypothetical protein DUNSADRAFT_4578 [Dunaliella salina]
MPTLSSAQPPLLLMQLPAFSTLGTSIPIPSLNSTTHPNASNASAACGLGGTSSPLRMASRLSMLRKKARLTLGLAAFVPFGALFAEDGFGGRIISCIFWPCCCSWLFAFL